MRVNVRRQFTARVNVNHEELFRLLTDAAKIHLSEEGIAYPSDAQFVIKLEQQKDGSPSYSNGKWGVEVIITSDRMPEDDAMKVEPDDK